MYEESFSKDSENEFKDSPDLLNYKVNLISF